MDGDGLFVLMRGIGRDGIDGAVAELAQEPDGTVTAEIRIPGPAAPWTGEARHPGTATSTTTPAEPGGT